MLNIVEGRRDMTLPFERFYTVRRSPKNSQYDFELFVKEESRLAKSDDVNG